MALENIAQQTQQNIFEIEEWLCIVVEWPIARQTENRHEN